MSDNDISSGVTRGCVGTVNGFGAKAACGEETDVVYVRFDHEVRSGLNLNEDGTYQMWRHQIEPVDATSAAIDAYQQACTDFEAAQLALEKAKAAVQDARLNLRDALDGEA